MSKSGKRSRPQIPLKTDPFSIGFWAALIKELGIPAFLILFFIFCFLCFASASQKKEFIDKFYLLKDVDNNPFPFSLTVLALLLIIYLQYVFYRKVLKVYKDEILRIGREKSELQKQLSGKLMNSDV